MPVVVPFGQQRRCEVKFETVPALELVLQLRQETAVGVEPRHLVLVLDGHQLEEIARRRIGQGTGFTVHLLVKRLDAPDPLREAIRIFPVLVGSEKLNPPVYGILRVLRNLLCRLGWRTASVSFSNGRRIMCCPTPPTERGDIHIGRLSVEPDGVFNGLRRNRQAAALAGKAKHEHVCRNRVAEQRRGALVPSK